MRLHTRPTWGFYAALTPPLLLAIDMVYENTALSWKGGPQMIGFTLLHTVGIILFPAILLSLVWCAGTVVLPLITKRWNKGNIAGAILIGALLAIASLPYGFWVKVFAQRIAAGPHSVEFLTYMSALGELSAVKALLDAGVPINASDKSGHRAIETAETAKQMEVRDFLASKGGTDKRF
jgi:hypothetical protein